MNNLIIPSSPTDRQAIRSAMKEISNSMVRTEGERDYIKETIDDLSDKFDLPKKYLKKVASAYHKQNIAETTEVADDVETLYEALFSAEA
jgi:hypothetical protein|tara:strand:+ start:1097 stop:1366 length:270 start_codon:yes stop_codon:yes gene_type:complete